MADANEKIRSLVLDAIENRGEIGLQVAAYVGEELVVDVAEGLADWETGRKCAENTVFTVFSATKGVAATALNIHVERGHLSYSTRIAEVWPEFGAHGKDQVNVRDALAHRIGVPQMPDGCTPEQMSDWDWMCDAIANMEPVWEPGTKCGYHAYTYGWIVGELVRRTDPKGRSFGQYIQDEICAPLGIDSLWMGIPDEVEPRVARLKNMVPNPDAPPMAPDSLLPKAIPPTLGTNQETFGRPDVRRSCHPGAGGIMNARSLARHYAALANGGSLGGVQILSPRTVRQLSELQSDEQDQVISSKYRRALGYWLGGDPEQGGHAIIGRNERAFGHPGAGGSIGWCDPDQRFSAAIVHNRMTAGQAMEADPLKQIADTLRAELNIRG